MRDAAISAGLVQASRAGERNWRDRLRIITLVHLLSFTDFIHFSSWRVQGTRGGGCSLRSSYGAPSIET